jgi:integrase-like protein
VADEVREALSADFRNAKHKAQWKSTLETYAAPLRAKPVDTIATDDVLAVLKPIWTGKAETAWRDSNDQGISQRTPTRLFRGYTSRR